MFSTLNLGVLSEAISALNQLLNLKQKPDTPENLEISNVSAIRSPGIRQGEIIQTRHISDVFPFLPHPPALPSNKL